MKLRALLWCTVLVRCAVAAAASSRFADHAEALPWRQDRYSPETRRRQLLDELVQPQRKLENKLMLGQEDEAMQRQRSQLCGHLDASQTTTAAGAWFSDALGNLWWEPAKCRLRRFSAAQARTCLADRHIAFVGDSVTRFQYLSLADFISRGKFAHPYGQVDGVPALPLQPEWGTWEDFFAGIPAHLEQGAANGTVHATCDCRHGQQAFPRQDPAAHEHHKFYLKPAAPIARELLETGVLAQGASTQLSFLLVLGSKPPQQAPIDGLLQAMRGTDEHGRGPDAVILNHGFWMLPGVSDGQLKLTPGLDLQQVYADVLQEGASFRQQRQDKAGDPALLWKTTTRSSWALEKQWAQLAKAGTAAAAAAPEWGLLDVRQLTDSALSSGLKALWDGVHPWPVVYEQFNDLLMNMLCNETLHFGLK